MRKNTLIALIVSSILIFSLHSTGAAQNKTPDSKQAKELETIYKELDAATKKRDAKPFEKYLDENFTVDQAGQKVTRAQMLELLRQFFEAAVNISESVSKIEKINLAPDGSYSLDVATLVKGRFKTPDGETSNLEIRGQATDIWTKTERGWRLIKQIDRGSKILVDGKEAPQ